MGRTLKEMLKKTLLKLREKSRCRLLLDCEKDLCKLMLTFFTATCIFCRLFYCYSSDSLDRAASSTEDRAHEPDETDHLSSVKLDAAGHAHIDKHRYN
jgi:hypothetical protein